MKRRAAFSKSFSPQLYTHAGADKAMMEQESLAMMEQESLAMMEQRNLAVNGLHNQFGRRLLPDIVDERALSGYSRPYAYVANSQTSPTGFVEVSYSLLANAVNRTSWWLENEVLKVCGKDGVFAYIGPSDLRYAALILATMKTGGKILLPSPKNHMDAQMKLFGAVGCRAIVYDSSYHKTLEHLLEKTAHIPAMPAPELEHIFAAGTEPPYESKVTYDNLADTPFMFVHTSGTSGNPKPIGYNHKFIFAFDTAHLLPTTHGKPVVNAGFRNQNCLSTLPFFHTGGFSYGLVFPIFYETTVVLGHPHAPWTPQYVMSLISHDTVTGMVVPPSILEDISSLPNGMETLATLDFIGWGGGPLPGSLGPRIAERVKSLCCIIGATEYGAFHYVQNGNPKDYEYVHFFDDIGYRFDQVSPDVFELVVVHDPKTKHFHGSAALWPEAPEFRTKDLYTPAPWGDGWWSHHGRLDSLLVLSNGEKINPIPIEDKICSHPLVRAAVLAGEHRTVPSLLVELQHPAPKTEEERQRILDQIWPTVNEANHSAPTFSRVPKSLIVLASSGTFQRATKGTVQRQLVIKDFTPQLEQAYIRADLGLSSSTHELVNLDDNDEVKEFIRTVYANVLEISGDELKDDEGLFERGVNSLQVTVIVQQLRAGLRSSNASIDIMQVDSQLIYSCPTLKQISDAVLWLIHNSRTAMAEPGSGGIVSSTDNMKAALAKFSKDPLHVPIRSQPQAEDSSDMGLCVVLTGSTGSLGKYLLNALLSRPKELIKKVICLSRADDPEARQRKLHVTHSIPTPWVEDSARAEFLTVDLSQSNLGLADSGYEKLRDEAMVIIHCAWSVNFNIPLSSFEKVHIAGLRHLHDLCATSPHRPPLLFCSSISATLNWGRIHPTSPVPESVIESFDAPSREGYAQSKYVSERLLEILCSASGVRGVILRVGQIAGTIAERGIWSKSEWFPSIIISSKTLGVIPDSLGEFDQIDWIPVDILSKIIVELVEHNTRCAKREMCGGGHAIVYNLVNPNCSNWTDMASHVRDELDRESGEAPVKSVSLKSWVEALQQSMERNRGQDMEKIPAVKLLDFFQNLAQQESTHKGFRQKYELERMMQHSSEAANLQRVSADWINKWVGEWKP